VVVGRCQLTTYIHFYIQSTSYNNGTGSPLVVSHCHSLVVVVGGVSGEVVTHQKKKEEEEEDATLRVCRRLCSTTTKKKPTTPVFSKSPGVNRSGLGLLAAEPQSCRNVAAVAHVSSIGALGATSPARRQCSRSCGDNVPLVHCDMISKG
jgi:hypothetical protein